LSPVYRAVASPEKEATMILKQPSLRSRRRRGFSMAEMLVVLVIIAFASTVSLLAYSNYRQGANVRTSAEKVRALLVNARARSIASGLPAAVTFDLDNQSYWIDDLDSALAIRAAKAIPPEVFPEEVIVESLKIGADVHEDGTRRIVFRPEGTNPFITVNLRRAFGDDVDTNYYAIQMYPTSADPKVWAHARK